mgnify:CR=1 FL=1
MKSAHYVSFFDFSPLGNALLSVRLQDWEIRRKKISFTMDSFMDLIPRWLVRGYTSSAETTEHILCVVRLIFFRK